MTLNEDVASEIQKLDPSAMIELYELDTTDLGGDVFKFHNGTNKLTQNIVWQGEEYVRFPIQVEGFEISGQGQFPRPTISVSNVLSAITAILVQYKDLNGAKFTRKRTFAKYLDAINFPGNVNPTEDPGVYLPDDIYWVDRKAKEDRDSVQFELSSAADLQGVNVPARTVIKSLCPWIYRGSDCGYTGIPLYDENDDELPMPVSAEAIAMRNAYQDFLDAETALAAAQADLDSKATILEAAKQYTVTVGYSLTAPTYYVKTYQTMISAYWNNAPVSLGTTYVRGDYVGTEKIGNQTWNVYKIERYLRDEAAVVVAQANYDAAVIARDAAQDDVDQAIVDFDAALAAVPSDDPVFTQDRCGKRVTSCKLRFQSIYRDNSINFGGFPGVSR